MDTLTTSTNSIHFTLEKSDPSGSLPFLDTLITVHPSGDWIRCVISSSSRVSAMPGEETEPFVGRVYQNDADSLDSEVVSIIVNQISEAFRYFPPNFYSSIKPEAEALVKLIIWHYTLRTAGGTFGQSLLGLSYNHLTPGKSALLALLTIGVSWLRDRLDDVIKVAGVAEETRHQLVRLSDRLDLLVRAAALLNLLTFLRDGRYLTLPERLLGLTKQRATQDVVSETNYTYLTREYLWRGFSELLMCVLPLLSFRQLGGALVRLLRRPRPLPAGPASQPRDCRCVWCGEPAILPRLLQCCHLACYYCLQVAAASHPALLPCPVCGAESQASEVRPLPVVRCSDTEDKSADTS